VLVFVKYGQLASMGAVTLLLAVMWKNFILLDVHVVSRGQNPTEKFRALLKNATARHLLLVMR